MEKLLELVGILIAGVLDIQINVTITGTMDIRDPENNYLLFTTPTTPADPPV